MRERGNVIVGDIMRRLFQRIENKFKAGIVAARDGDAAEIFQKSGEQSGGFPCGFLLQSLEPSPAQILRNPILAGRVEYGGKVVEGKGDRDACAPVPTSAAPLTRYPR